MIDADAYVVEAVPLALLCADQVITEEGTQKRSIIGTFTNFHSQQFPASLPPWFVYLSFTNATGEHTITVNIHNPTTNFNVFSASATVAIEDRGAQVELAVPVLGASFPEPGSYEVYVSKTDREPAAEDRRHAMNGRGSTTSQAAGSIQPT